MKLLHLMASPRGDRSRSVALGQTFVQALRDHNPSLKVDELDLFKEDLPEVTQNASEAKYSFLSGQELKKEEMAAWEKMAQYSNQFLSYDFYVVSNPMWNYSIPYKLKHYIDVIMQAGVLFRFTATGVEGLALNKKMVCITTRGSEYVEGTFMHQFDHQEPYLRSIFGLAGIHDISFLHAQPLDMAPGITEEVLHKAMEEARKMASELSPLSF